MTRPILVLTLFVTWSSARGADVKYLDRTTGKEETAKDVTITEDVKGITFRRGGKVVTVSALDVRDVKYDAQEIKPLSLDDLDRPGSKLRQAALPRENADSKRKLYREVIQAVTALLPKVPSELRRVRRHLLYQSAEASYRLAQLDGGRREEALAALTRFKEEHNDGWQLAPTLMKLAKLQEAKGDAAAVQKTYEELAAVPGISAEIHTTSLLRVAQTLMKAEKFTAAEDKLQDLQKTLPANSPEASRVKVHLAQCQVLGNDASKAEQAEKSLRQLAGSGDASLQGLIHNTLGDYLLKKNKPEEAFWEFLRVDVLYNSDKNEHARALYHLARLFREVRKDGPRADACLEQLKEKRFEGTEYQKKAAEK